MTHSFCCDNNWILCSYQSNPPVDLILILHCLKGGGVCRADLTRGDCLCNGRLVLNPINVVLWGYVSNSLSLFMHEMVHTSVNGGFSLEHLAHSLLSQRRDSHYKS